MSVKELLEKIWNSPGCLCPSHTVWWCCPYDATHWIQGFCFRRGRLVQLKGLPRKTGRASWLFKGYGLWARIEWSKYPKSSTDTF